MSKSSIFQREKKRFFLFNKFLNYRNSLKKKIKNFNFFFNKKFDLLYSIQKLPKNSSPTRIKNRCCLTGRPRGVFRMFGLSRIIVRKFSSKGYIPGLLKNSW